MPETPNHTNGVDTSDEKFRSNGHDLEEEKGDTQSLLKTHLGENLAPLTKTAVEKLGVEKFIEVHGKDQIFPKLEDCDKHAENAKVDSDMMFIALSLPVINGIIHIASNPTNLKKAMGWVYENWTKVADVDDPDAISILSALTLLYVSIKGEEANREEPDKKEIWQRILQRVKLFSKEMNN